MTIYISAHLKTKKRQPSCSLKCFVSILVQSPNLSHPFHLHGTPYNVIGIGRSPDKNIKKINLKHALDLDRKGLLHRQYNLPPFKDTLAVPNNGYVVLRLKADNPGKILFLIGFSIWRCRRPYIKSYVWSAKYDSGKFILIPISFFQDTGCSTVISSIT